MKKAIWRISDEPNQEQFIQIYEFIRVPNSEVMEIRIFFDLSGKDFYRSRKYHNGKVEWYQASIYAIENVP